MMQRLFRRLTLEILIVGSLVSDLCVKILLNNWYQDPVGSLVQDFCIRTFCARSLSLSLVQDLFQGLCMRILLHMMVPCTCHANEVHVRKRARTSGKKAPSKLRFVAANFVLYLFLIFYFLSEIQIWVFFISTCLSWNLGHLRTLTRFVQHEPPASWSSGCMWGGRVVGSLWSTSCRAAHSRRSGVTRIALARGFALGCL